MKIQFAKVIPIAEGFLVTFGEVDEHGVFYSSGASKRKTYRRESNAMKAKLKYEGKK